MAEKSGELNNLKINDDDEQILETSLEKRADDYPLTGTEPEEFEATEEVPDEAVQIREQIVETRREMSETIDAIQEKLSFANISEQVQTQVSEQINNAVETAKDVFFDKTADVANTVSRGFKSLENTELAKKAKENPTALALIGAGIGALLVSVLVSGKTGKKSKYRSDDYEVQTAFKYESDFEDDEIRYADTSRRGLQSGESAPSEGHESVLQTVRGKVADTTSSAYKTAADTAGAAYGGVKGAASSALETVGAAASKTFEGASDVAGKTYETVGNAAGKTYQALGSAASYSYEKAGDLGEQMKTNYDHYIEENPLAVGVVAFAVGAAVGLAIPLTRKENEYLGEYRDQVFEKAQAKFQETVGSVKDLAAEAQRVVAEEVKAKTA